MGAEVRGIRIPAVAEAIIFDLALGDSKSRPDAEMGYRACLNAENKLPWKDGNTGAGMGASVGKLAGMERAVKGGAWFMLHKSRGSLCGSCSCR